MRYSHAQPFATWSASIAACHLRTGTRLIDEDQRFRIEVELAIELGLARAQDVGAVLFLRVASLYGMARPFSPASGMMPVLEKGKERTDVYCDPWR